MAMSPLRLMVARLHIWTVTEMAIETQSFFQSAYQGDAPPWDIGRPQRDMMAAFDALPAAGSALDVGCGTGEHVLELARRGLDAWGIDATAAAIERARAKAQRAGASLTATFVLGDALALSALGRRFDRIVDCGLYHVISDEERRRYVAEVRAALVPGGVHVMLGFQTNLHDRGPRGYSPEELRAAFADGWFEQTIREAVYETRDRAHGQPAWLSVFVRAA